jgi:hypothetical protein
MFGAPWARLAVGSVLLLAIAAAALGATSPALAFSIKSDLPNLANAGSPSNAAGSVSHPELLPESIETFTARYTFATYTAAGQGAVGPADMTDATIIGTMWQQWRHEQQNNWFYLYARNTASATAPATWSFYFYSRERGAHLLVKDVADGETMTADNGDFDPNSPTIFLPGENDEDVPMMSIESVTADVNPAGGASCNPGAAPPATQCSAQFSTQLRWGISQSGFKAGTLILTQAVETLPIRGGAIQSPTVYYDAWESPLPGGDARVRLRNNAPTQSTTGLTNASGSRRTNLSTPYTMTQTVADVDGDLNSAQLIWVQTSGPAVGTWFTVGVVLESVDEGLENPGSDVSSFYESWNEERVDPLTGEEFMRYLNAFSVTATPTNAAIGGVTGTRSLAVTYRFIYSNAARGTWTVFGRAEDWHGGTSGNVPTGSQTISIGP